MFIFTGLSLFPFLPPYLPLFLSLERKQRACVVLHTIAVQKSRPYHNMSSTGDENDFESGRPSSFPSSQQDWGVTSQLWQGLIWLETTLEV